MEEGKDFLTQWQEYTDKILKELLNSDQASNPQGEQNSPLSVLPEPSIINSSEPPAVQEISTEEK